MVEKGNRGNVYVLYADGSNQVVAFSDSLSREEAESFRSRYIKEGTIVTEVILTDDHEKLVKRFTFTD
ncbi:MAG: hypothetical protein K6A80_08430 [Saccharofermentans sp.]|nr:hypothetical protein [Saccharofermentans sp.]